MADQTMEARVAALEQQVADMRQQMDTIRGQPDPQAKWWERITPWTEDMCRAWDEIAPQREYIRITGQSPPPGWKPGDPIPEPDHWR